MHALQITSQSTRMHAPWTNKVIYSLRFQARKNSSNQVCLDILATRVYLQQNYNEEFLSVARGHWSSNPVTGTGLPNAHAKKQNFRHRYTMGAVTFGGTLIWVPKAIYILQIPIRGHLCVLNASTDPCAARTL